MASTPANTVVYIPVKVDRTLVNESVSHFIYQVDLSEYLLFPALTGEVTNSNNVTVFDPLLKTSLPKKVVYDFVNRRFFVFWDGEKSTSVDRFFYICVGHNINIADSYTPFTNNSIENFWGFDEITDAMTSANYSNGAQLVKYGNASLGNVGVFQKAAEIIDTDGSFICSTNFVGSGDFMLSCFFKLNYPSANCPIYETYERSAWLRFQGGYIAFTSNGVTSSGTPFSTYGSWNHLAINRSASGQHKIYINGNLVFTVALGGNSTTFFPLRIGNDQASASPIRGNIDNMITSSVLKTDAYIKDLYNQVANPLFFTKYELAAPTGLRRVRLVGTNKRISNYDILSKVTIES